MSVSQIKINQYVNKEKLVTLTPFISSSNGAFHAFPVSLLLFPVILIFLYILLGELEETLTMSFVQYFFDDVL